MLQKVQSTIDRISQIAVWVGGSALLIAAFGVSIDVILRKLFGITLAGSDELSGYILAISTTWAFALVLRKKGNVRIDVLYRLMPEKIRLFLDVLSFLALGGLFFIMTRSAFILAWNTTRDGAISVTPLQTPLAVPQILWVMGFAITLVMWLVIFCRTINSLCKKDWRTTFDLIGSDSVEETIDNELGKGELGKNSLPNIIKSEVEK